MPGGSVTYQAAGDYGALVVRVIARALAGESGDQVEGQAHRQLAAAYNRALAGVVALDHLAARLLSDARGADIAPLLELDTEEWHTRMHRVATCPDHDPAAEEADELRLMLIAATDHAGGTVELSPGRLMDAGAAGRMVAWWYDEQKDATVLTTDEGVADAACTCEPEEGGDDAGD